MNFDYKNRTLRVFTAFSGYDSQCLALKRLSKDFPGFKYELVGWSEIDRDAIKAHNILFPECADKNYGDISMIDWNEVPDFDLLTYSSPCFTAGTKVRTKDGFKNIEDIQVGDEVVSHTGEYRKVIDTMSHEYSGMYLVEITGCEKNRRNGNALQHLIRCTPNHKFYVREKDSDKLVWKEIGRLEEGDMLYEYRRYWNDAVDMKWYVPDYFKLVEITEPVTVYNLSVEIDESYNVCDIIVHNCTDFSLAGRQQGGEEGSGTRSSLLWEVRKCIEAKKPKFLLLENVTALVSKKFYPLFMKWVDTVGSYGYESFWDTLNAKQYGVPQNRDRVFLVSIRKETSDEIINYNFPNPLNTDCKMEDILDDVKDSQYFINQEKVNEWSKENEKRIIEYVAERNNLSPDDLSIENSDNEEIKDETPVKLSEEEKVNEEKMIEEIIEETLDVSTLAKKPNKKKKEKTPLRGGHMVTQIPTPLTSNGDIPTLMATGYESANYKNWYSVGHFPKLGILEVWNDGSDVVMDYSHDTKTNTLL